MNSSPRGHLHRVALAIALAAVPWLAQAQGLQSLALLVTGGATWSPAFSPATTRYSAQVQSDIGVLNLAAQPAAGGSLALSANGKPADEKTPLQLPLAVGSNQIDLQGKDAACAVQGRYQIAIERENIQPVIDRFQKRSFTDASTGLTMLHRLWSSWLPN
jgi:hypothetical protein